MPRRKLDIDATQVERLAQLHCTNVEIASFFGCDEKTIRNRFSEELTKGRSMGKISLRRHQWKSAEAGNVSMLIWLGKQYLAQSDRPEMTDDDIDRVIKFVRATGREKD